MVEKKGVIGIVYDNNGGSLYFLIVHRNIPGNKVWEFVKGLVVGEMNTADTMQQEVHSKLGMTRITIKKKLDFTIPIKDGADTVINEVFLIETSMNIPVTLDYDPNKINTYLWSNKKRTMETLSPAHRELLEKAMPELEKLTA